MNLDQMLKGGWWGESPFADRRMIVTPAHPSNYYTQRVCKPIAGVFHEPQEPSDNYESTPVYFQTPNIQASTRYYNDNDGDVYQMVPIDRPAIANGLDGMPMPKFNDGGPEFGAFSINDQTENSEVEGMTATIAKTMTEAQWQGCVDVGVLWMVQWDWPRSVGRFLSHKQLSRNRTDGEWIVKQSGIPQEVVKRVLKIEKDIIDLKGYAWNAASKNNGQDTILINHALRLNELEKK